MDDRWSDDDSNNSHKNCKSKYKKSKRGEEIVGFLGKTYVYKDYSSEGSGSSDMEANFSQIEEEEFHTALVGEIED